MSVLVPTAINQVDVEEELTGEFRVPVMAPGELMAKAGLLRDLAALGIRISATTAPTVDDDESAGHWVGRRWIRLSPLTEWVCSSAASGAAAWHDMTTPAVTGLTNPLSAALNGNNQLIYTARFAGLRDWYYDLASDPSNLVSAGVASLNGVYNAWHFAGLDAELEVELPDPVQTGGGAVFGVLSFELGSGGEVSIGDGRPWVWEKAHPADPDPVIPVEVGSQFRIRYSWDPAAEVYGLSLSFLSPAAPVSLGEVTLVSGSLLATHRTSNGDTHGHTHTWLTETQNGGLYLLLLFAADGNAAPSATPAGCTPVNDPPSGSGSEVQGRWYLFKPSQGNLDGDTTVFEWTKTNEQSTIVSIEVQGPPAGVEVGELANNRASSSSRTSITGPVVTVPDGALVVSGLTKDRSGSNGTEANAAVATAYGFDSLFVRNTSTSDLPIVNINAREVETGGGVSTPDYSTNSGTVAGASQCEVFVLVPAAP